MVSAMVPLDRALLSSCELYIVTIILSVMVWPLWRQFAIQILNAGSNLQISLSRGRTGAHLIQSYLGQMASHSVKWP